MKNLKEFFLSPWSFVPSLYFAQGIPYSIVATTFAVIMYKQLGLSNAQAALYTSWLYLPWVVKPFWSPVVDMFRTKRWWIISMQFVIGALLAFVAFSLSLPYFVQSSLALMWLLAFLSATHDIAVDGFYIEALSEKNQALFVGIRSTFYRISMIVGQGALVMLAGWLETRFSSVKTAWSVVFIVVSALFVCFALYHRMVISRSAVNAIRKEKSDLKEFLNSFKTFFQKKDITISLLFILLYRLGEAQLVKVASPFLLDSVEKGGLGLSTAQVGFVYGTVGVILLTIGGILGGVVIAKNGLKKWLFPMALAMNVPNIVYFIFSFFQIQSMTLISIGVGLEQFGYGFGFTAYMLYLIKVAQGEFQTSHYAICTGFMALGMMLPGMIAGAIQEMIGYNYFFLWVCLCTIPGFILLKFIKV